MEIYWELVILAVIKMGFNHLLVTVTPVWWPQWAQLNMPTLLGFKKNLFPRGGTSGNLTNEQTLERQCGDSLDMCTGGIVDIMDEGC